MKSEKLELAALLSAGGGVLACRDHRHLRRALSRAAAAGHLVRVLRGVYVAAGTETDTAILVRAVQTAYPDAIFTGLTAAWINGMRDKPPARVAATHAGRSISTPRVRLSHGHLDPSLWVEKSGGLRVLTQIMTALDAIPELGGELVDLLHRKARNAGQLAVRFAAALACTGNRPGNQERRRVVSRSVTNPWSELERRLHDLLDAAGIGGWVANRRLTPRGRVVHLDVSFATQLLVVEVDGYEFHSDKQTFVDDRRRGNVLLLEGWRVLHFTWDDLEDHPEVVVGQIQEALSQGTVAFANRRWPAGGSTEWHF